MKSHFYCIISGINMMYEIVYEFGVVYKYLLSQSIRIP